MKTNPECKRCGLLKSTIESDSFRMPERVQMCKNGHDFGESVSHTQTEDIREEWMKAVILNENMSDVEANEAMADWWTSKFNSRLQSLLDMQVDEEYEGIPLDRVEKRNQIFGRNQAKAQFREEIKKLML